MRKVTCSLGISLDGYINGPDGGFDWGAPTEELFRFCTDEVRGLGVHLLGRRLYEMMTYWDDIEADPTTGDLEREFAALWNAVPKVVFSTTLTSVSPNYELARGSVAAEIQRWKAEPGEGNIGLGGADLLAQAAAQDLVDEYRLRISPVLVGGGTPFFPRAERRSDLELVDKRTFDNGVVHLHYRVLR